MEDATLPVYGFGSWPAARDWYGFGFELLSRKSQLLILLMKLGHLCRVGRIGAFMLRDR
jgi:hypothetical protein